MADERHIRLTSSPNAQMARLVTTGNNYDPVRVVTHPNADLVNPRGNMDSDTYRVINPQDIPSEFSQYIH